MLKMFFDKSKNILFLKFIASTLLLILYFFIINVLYKLDQNTDKKNLVNIFIFFQFKTNEPITYLNLSIKYLQKS